MTDKRAWFSIWVSPRATIQRIVSENPKQGLWMLATIYGFSGLLGFFQSFAFGSFLGPIGLFLLALIIAPFWGYVIFAVWSAVVTWTGRWFKGSGSFQEVRASYAWSNVPLLVSDIIWVALLVLFGSILFMEPSPGPSILQEQATILLTLLFAKVVLSIWSLVIFLNALAEVQKFSILRAIGNVIVSGIIVGVVVAFLSIGALYLLGESAEPSGPVGTAFLLFQGTVPFRI